MNRILIVEDNQDVAEVFAQLVEIIGHETKIAADVEPALALTREWLPAMVLCDLGLPGDGLEFARACKREEALRSIRLIAVSGFTSDEHTRRAHAAGFDDLLCKPLDFSTLQRICEA
ncbi:response regulator [Uliginosibacterium sp. H3]|uniref:Response regulator n=1 Tax=Uliginosibacterium silvisoli TaxID=3114758 RepID=A0ABU6K8H8_9RHOO|nr:response regulator [Uliginosibacterium sp. H3]